MINVLFICTANVCRSPMAEGYLKLLLQRIKLSEEISSSSAGVYAVPGTPAFECAAEVAALHGYDIREHRARLLTLELAQESDLILCMEAWHAARVLDLDPDLVRKLSLLGKFHPSKQPLLQIPDPREFTVSETIKIFSFIKESVEGYIKTLSLSSGKEF